jgi:RimJ/RimL family protein N-acetyltransferase
MLRDEVVYLRKLEETDLDRTFDWMQRPDIYQAIGVHIPISRRSQQKWFESTDSTRDKVIFAVCRSSDDQHVGNVSLDTIDTRHRNARLSAFIADKGVRGEGLGSHALMLLLRYAFDFLNLHRVYLKMNAGEDRVLEYYQRVGFEVEGELREHEFQNGQYVNKLMLGVLKSEWESRMHTRQDDKG